MRRGACGSPRGAARLIRDSLATLNRLPGFKHARVLFRADSAYYGFAPVNAAITAGAAVSVTARMDPAVKRAIATIPRRRVGARSSTRTRSTTRTRNGGSPPPKSPRSPSPRSPPEEESEHITGRLVVRRIPELNKKDLDQPTLFDTHRFHAFFTTSTLDTVTADKIHRRHAIIEQVNADLKHSALAHLPSGVFTANAAWLVLAVIAFNLTRASATITGAGLAKATTATIRRKLVTIPARIASSATTHHPAPARPVAMGNRLDRTVRSRRRITPAGPDDLTIQPTTGATRTTSGTPGQTGPALSHAQNEAHHSNRNQTHTPAGSVD